jgi:hypothetical protein
LYNPYFYHGPSLESSATHVFLIAPADDTDLERVCKGIRIWNPETTPQTVRYKSLDGDVIDVTVPANSLWIEPAVITQVHNTGSGDTLIIHGYSD